MALLDGKEVEISPTDKKLCAFAFKVIHDQQKGPIVFVRVYSGVLESRSVLCISSSKTKERASKLLELYADDYEEVRSIEAGNIGAVLGFKDVKTGDTLLLSTDDRNLNCNPITIPPPVFIRSVEPKSSSDEKQLQDALYNLIREDPSLSLQTNEETGQLLISGMGELHLEIAGERLIETYKVPCTLGKVEISYRETTLDSSTYELNYDRNILGTHHQCSVELKVESIYTEEGNSVIHNIENNQILIDTSVIPDLTNTLFPNSGQIKKAVLDGINGALSRGPLLGYPVSHLKITLKNLRMVSPETSTTSAIRSATQQCIAHILKENAKLLEPIMSLKISVPPQYVGNVTRDLSGHRRGNINELEQSDTRVTIHASAPLSELIGYVSFLRGMTAGTGEWVMDLKGYHLIPSSKQDDFIKSIRGY